MKASVGKVGLKYDIKEGNSYQKQSIGETTMFVGQLNSKSDAFQAL